VDGSRVPDVSVDAKSGKLLIKGRPPAYLPQGSITEVLKGPSLRPGAPGRRCIECGQEDVSAGWAFAGGALLGRWLAS